MIYIVEILILFKMIMGIQEQIKDLSLYRPIFNS